MGARLVLVALAFGFFSSASAEEPAPTAEAPAGEDVVFSLGSPIGPIEYRAGRGLHLGNTGLNIGGFAAVEFEREKGGPGLVALDNLNFLVLFEPTAFLKGFAEVEVDELFEWEINSDKTTSNVNVNFERLYGDLSLDDAINLRVGKFQTPVGRWNLIRAEPLTWTASEPALVEEAFDEHQTGGAVFGSLLSSSDALSYWLYGQFMDPLDPDTDSEPAERSAGGRLEYGGALGEFSVGVSFLASELSAEWNYLAGLDAEWQIGPLGLMSEFAITRGDIEGRDLWGVYLQGVYEALPGVYLVARYEHFDPSGSGGDADLADLGVTWIPLSFLRLKVDYRISNQQTELVRRGLNANLSVLF
jgi:hypothetical protein